MKNKIKKQIEEGCGKETDCYGYPKISGGWKCGEQYLEQEIILCPECKAQLKGFEKAEKEIIKKIERMIIEVPTIREENSLKDIIKSIGDEE